MDYHDNWINSFFSSTREKGSSCIFVNSETNVLITMEDPKIRFTKTDQYIISL